MDSCFCFGATPLYCIILAVAAFWPSTVWTSDKQLASESTLSLCKTERKILIKRESLRAAQPQGLKLKDVESHFSNSLQTYRGSSFSKDGLQRWSLFALPRTVSRTHGCGIHSINLAFFAYSKICCPRVYPLPSWHCHPSLWRTSFSPGQSPAKGWKCWTQSARQVYCTEPWVEEGRRKLFAAWDQRISSWIRSVGYLDVPAWSSFCWKSACDLRPRRKPE